MVVIPYLLCALGRHGFVGTNGVYYAYGVLVSTLY
jgi:hypothetical protein